MDDNKGLSMIIVNSPVGEKFIQKIDGFLSCTEYECSYDTAKECNPAIFKSMERPKVRDEFYVDVNRLSFDKLGNKYMPLNCKVKLKGFLGRIGILEKLEKMRGR